MHYESFVTNDNIHLTYQTSIPITSNKSHGGATPAEAPSACLLLLHGFSGSSEYFVRNTPTLSQSHWVLAPDMRGHGRSAQPTRGYHVARLAMDLHELLQHIRGHYPTTSIYAVGCSIGAAILWTYVELFTDKEFHGLVFVDQAPLQNRSQYGGWGEGLAHYGCYDEATMLEAQRCWGSHDKSVREDTYKDLVKSCLGYRYSPQDGDTVTEDQSKQDEVFFTSISRQCNGGFLARLLADHTSYDHREAIEQITKPVLVLAGKRSGCFSIAGMMQTVQLAQVYNAASAKGVVFESGHWLFWEEPDRFNQELLDFVASCTS